MFQEKRKYSIHQVSRRLKISSSEVVSILGKTGRSYTVNSKINKSDINVVTLKLAIKDLKPKTCDFNKYSATTHYVSQSQKNEITIFFREQGNSPQLEEEKKVKPNFLFTLFDFLVRIFNLERPDSKLGVLLFEHVNLSKSFSFDFSSSQRSIFKDNPIRFLEEQRNHILFRARELSVIALAKLPKKSINMRKCLMGQFYYVIGNIFYIYPNNDEEEKLLHACMLRSHTFH